MANAKMYSDDLNNNSNGLIFMYGMSTANKPSDYGTYITFGGSCEGSAFRNQIAIGTNSTMWFRININNGGWTKWFEMSTLDQIWIFNILN